MKKRIRIILITLTVIVLIGAGGFFWYVSDYYHADEQVVAVQKSSTMHFDKTINSYVFEATGTLKGGIIFYPGAKVDELAYTPLMEKLSQQGYFCVLVQMPFHLAVLNTNAAITVIEKYDQIKQWYLMGHSLGGAMAAQYASDYSDSLSGLILLGAYSTQDLSRTSLQVLSIYGSEDGVLNRKKYQEYYKNLPAKTKELIIQGGNHAQFGNYGIQSGDENALISTQQQQNQTVEFIINELFY